MNQTANPTVRQALDDYFERNGFGADGGYGLTWIGLRFGPLTVPLYNSQARRRAVPLHDLHHIATGYDTTPLGEAEMAAWEVASGVHDKWFALFINLPAVMYGLVLWPKRTLAAWKAGRVSTSLYRYEYDDWLLSLTVTELRALVAPGQRPHR